jgi:hypothetical protein
MDPFDLGLLTLVWRHRAAQHCDQTIRAMESGIVRPTALNPNTTLN